jgi:ubiquinone biosynthesis protein Coq4
MPPRPRLRRELLHLATDLAAVAENPADVEHVFDLLSRSYATPAADTARACLRADPHIAPLLKERYAPPWPELAQLLALPPDTLGGRYGRWFGAAGLPQPPEPVLAAGTAADDQWLHQRAG